MPVRRNQRTSTAATAAVPPRLTARVRTVNIDLPVLAGLAAQHRAGRAEHGRTLWQMLMLEKSLKSLFG